MRKNLKFKKIILNQKFRKPEVECAGCGKEMPKTIYLTGPRCIECQLKEKSNGNNLR